MLFFFAGWHNQLWNGWEHKSSIFAAGGGLAVLCWTLLGRAKLGESKEASGISGCGGGAVVVVVALLVVGLGFGVVLAVVVLVVVVVEGGLMATGLWNEFSGTRDLLGKGFLFFFAGWHKKLWKGWEHRSSSVAFFGTGLAKAGTKTELSGTGCSFGVGVVGATVVFIVLGGTDFFVVEMNVGSRNEFSPNKGGERLSSFGASFAGIDADASG